MAGFIEEVDRGQQSLLPGSLDGWVHKDNSVRVIDTFDDWSRGDRRVNLFHAGAKFAPCPRT
jgi:hypothetical protein